MKKRIMAALLCLCLLNGTVAAYADSVKADNLGTIDNKVFDETGFNWNGIDIHAIAQKESDTLTHEHVYQVEIVWGDMAFAYGATENITKTWKPEDHTYSDDADEREKEWYLVDAETELTSLYYDADGSYAEEILAGTSQSHVVLINHSDEGVKANVQIAGTLTDESAIEATIAQDSELFTQNAAVENENGGWDVDLSYDEDAEGTMYSGENKSAAAFVVSMAGEPAENELTEEASTVAKITIKLTPNAAVEDADADEDGDENSSSDDADSSDSSEDTDSSSDSNSSSTAGENNKLPATEKPSVEK